MNKHNNKYIILPINKIIEEYDAGMTPAELGRKYFVSKITIYRRIKEYHKARYRGYAGKKGARYEYN